MQIYIIIVKEFVKETFEDGSIKVKETKDNEGKMIRLEEFNLDGSLFHCKRYHDNGNLMKEDIYEFGKLKILKIFDEEGRLHGNGAYKEYHDNGQISKVVNYEHGNIIPLWSEYYKLGNPKLRVWLNDNKIKKYQEYDPKGKQYLKSYLMMMEL